ncbi:C40 family peptidase [Marinococcus sp. PL1-022]|uniref:C40 family peptidase n=1 Tax=Marinococcus sp. PL1-022 TaxID=3095363 RepID=UPI0029C3B8FA|nr:NlpC/P60 family protein [Marinococcus sp. PL1-022]MDX6151436.1 NlpC/P60 family protein [Marinococcus sp. PL1-022]
MFKSNRQAPKYILSSAVVTALALTPALSGNADAFADPDSDESSSSSQSDSSDTENETESADDNLLYLGDTGSSVESLQSALSDLDYYNSEADGTYDDETVQAVEAFQTENNLSIDGIAGPETMGALDKTDGTSEAGSETEESSSENSEDNDEGEEVASASSEESSEPTAESTSANTSDSGLVASAESVLGTPYEWGGTTASGFGSSGFINYVFEENGTDLSRTHEGIWQNNGEFVDEPSVGDIVFYEDTYNTEGASHSGLYIGEGQMIHSGSNGVEVADTNSDYWEEHYIGAKSID